MNKAAYLRIADKAEELSLTGPMKAVAMLLIVLTHCCSIYTGHWFTSPAVEAPIFGLIAEWLGSVHVPVFVLLSGYIWGYLKLETSLYDSGFAVMRKKACRLLVPYVFACVVWAVPFWILFNGTSEVVSKFVLGSAPSQLWFLLMLFAVFAIFESIFAVGRGKKILAPAPILTLSLLLYIAGAVLGKVLPLSCFQISAACAYAPLFALGCVMRQVDTKRFWSLGWYFSLAGNLALFAIARFVGDFDFALAGPLASCLTLFTRIAGALFAVRAMGAMNGLLEKLRGGMLDSNSYGIYLFHQQIIWVVLSFINVPGIPAIVVVIACFFVSLMVSMLISMALNKFRVTRFLIGRS